MLISGATNIINNAAKSERMFTTFFINLLQLASQNVLRRFNANLNFSLLCFVHHGNGAFKRPTFVKATVSPTVKLISNVYFNKSLPSTRSITAFRQLQGRLTRDGLLFKLTLGIGNNPTVRASF